MESNLTAVGIEYLFLGEELGVRPKNPDLYINGKVSYDAIRQTAVFKEGINKVMTLVDNGIKVTLMCSESDPNDCHRNI